MSETAITLDRISKHYRLGAGPQGRGDFRDAAGAAAARLRHRLLRRPLAAGGADAAREVWALRDVSFDVRKGEVVGLIGHNGAGKSTLLKILSRITDPTSGTAWFDGRLGSLLEVGTGFHPELTGRENIFLSGAILGMSRREIAGRFDEIVEFSEMERFLDTPVKRYSSGMYVRLGFAVAAHLDPEVLIVDEVLAVGDASFQRKCMAKMKGAAREGRTILFVSHNMGSVQQLCDRAVVLRAGRVVSAGVPEDAVKFYLKAAAEQTDVPLAQRRDRRGLGRTTIVAGRIFTEGHEDAPGLVMYGQPARVEFQVNEVRPKLTCKFAIHSYLNGTICRFTSLAEAPDDSMVGGSTFACEIPEMPLVPGQYRIDATILSGSQLEDFVENAIVFDVAHGALAGRVLAPAQRTGIFAPRHRWDIPHGTR